MDVVDVEQRALRAFSQDGFPSRDGVAKLCGYVGNEGREPRYVIAVFRQDGAGVQFRRAERGQGHIRGFDVVAQAFDKVRRKHVDHTQAGAGGFVGIGRADAASGGADVAFAARRFLGFVDGLVGGRDQVGSV